MVTPTTRAPEWRAISRIGPPDAAARVEDHHAPLQAQAIGDVAFAPSEPNGKRLALLERAEVERPSPAEFVKTAAQRVVQGGHVGIVLLAGQYAFVVVRSEEFEVEPDLALLPDGGRRVLSLSCHVIYPDDDASSPTCARWR